MPIASDSSPPPSNWRYVVVLMTMLAALWMYVDRVCFSILADPIRGSLGIDAADMSYVLGAFFFAYAICQVPAGALADRWGPRVALAACVAGWSAATAVTSFVGGLYGLLAARLLLGVAEAGAYPAAAGLVANWASPKERGSFSGIVSLGGRLGGASAPYLTGALAVALVAWSPETAKDPDLRLMFDLKAVGDIPTEDKDKMVVADVNGVIYFRIFGAAGTMVVDTDETRLPEQIGPIDKFRKKFENLRGPLALSESEKTVVVKKISSIVGYTRGNWRAVFFIFGSTGILVAALVWLLVRDRPPLLPDASLPAKTLAEEASLPATEKSSAVATPPAALLLIVQSVNLWLCSATQFGVNLGWAFLVTSLPSYLSRVYHVPLEERGLMQSVPLFVGAVGMLGGGFLTDLLRGPLGRRWCRSAPIGGALLLASAAFFTIPFLASAWAAVAAFACVALLVDLGVPAIWAFNQDVGGRSVGKVFGWGNMWGNLGAALSPVLLHQISERFGWSAVFNTCGAAYVAAGVCGLLMNATRPLEPPVVRLPLPPE